MSIEAVSWALKQQHISDTGARFVLIGLANHAGNDGKRAFPSIETLAGYTGLSRRSVIRKLQILEDAGIITRGNQAIVAAFIERPDRRPTVYDLNMDFRGDTESPGAERGDTEAVTGCQPGTNGVTTVHERGVTVTPEPSVKPSTKPSVKPSKEKASPVGLPEWLPQEAWADFVEHRRKIKAAMTDNAMRLAIKKLAKLRDDGHCPTEILENAVLNGWKGLFPVRDRPANDNTPRNSGKRRIKTTGLSGHFDPLEQGWRQAEDGSFY